MHDPRFPRVTTVEVDGLQLVSIRLSGLDGRGILDTLGEAARLIRAHPEGSARILTDLTDAKFDLHSADGSYDRRVVEGIKSYTIRNAPHVHSTAVVVRRDETSRIFMGFLEQISGRHFELFETREAAIVWLLRQEPIYSTTV